jgi:molecular chaperone DnaJ
MNAQMLLALMALAAPGERELIDRVAAVVNEEVITMSEVESAAKPFLEQNPTEEQRKALFNDVLEQLISERLLSQQIKEANITVEALAGCDSCAGRGARGQRRAQTCSTCGGAGKVRAQQGFFVVERGCPACRGSGEVIADPCTNCDGEGRALKRRSLSVKIPAGVDEGTRIRVSGEGEAGVRNAASGDLYIFVHMKRHGIYAREGTTLIAECPVSFTTAALGGSISLPGLDGAKIDIKIPPGIQSGEQLRQRGAGMSVLNGRGRGDLVAKVLVETPRRMSAKQKKLLEEFRKTETGDECPAAKSFFQRVRETFGS